VSFDAFVAKRYLRAKRKQAFIGFIAVVTLIGITVGVMALNLALAIHNGMREAFMESLVGKTGKLYLLSASNQGFDEDQLALMRETIAEDDRIHVMALMNHQVAFVLSDGVTRPVFTFLKGVEPRAELQGDSEFTRLDQGDLLGLEVLERAAPDPWSASVPGIALGFELARKLGVSVGDRVRVFLPRLTNGGLVQRQPGLKTVLFSVVAVFKTGQSEKDENNALIHLDAYQRFLQQTEVEVVQLFLRSSAQMEEIKDDYGRRWPGMVRVLDMRDLNQGLLRALALEKWGTSLIVGLIILIAALNMVSALTMLVMEKHRDIGIMRALGANRRHIAAIFLRQGMTLSVRGTLSGTFLGVCLAWVADHYRWIRMDYEVYEVLSFLPFKVHASEVVLVALGSLLISLVASWYPARQAARMNPSEALRYE
jgi:lipoprotein-releasing system permease protein